MRLNNKDMELSLFQFKSELSDYYLNMQDEKVKQRIVE